MKRCLPILGVFLLLLAAGAIVNVAVAWGCAARPKNPFSIFSTGNVDSPCGSYELWDDRLETSKSADIRPGDFRAANYPLRWLGTPGMLGWPDETRFPDAIPRWSKFHGGKWPLAALTASGETRDVDYIERASGWPLYALRYEWLLEFDNSFPKPNTTGSYGLLLIPAEWLPKGYQTDLPWLPLWPGFAIDTIFYATILWLLFAAPGTLRRWRRIKRGLCPVCAYPVGTSHVCTECGKPVKVRSVEPASS
jgi:hypothetical protein